jgi:hypothetical protein
VGLVLDNNEKLADQHTGLQGLEYGTAVLTSIGAKLWQKHVAAVKQEDATTHSML